MPAADERVLYFIRHGITAGNVRREFFGQHGLEAGIKAIVILGLELLLAAVLDLLQAAVTLDGVLDTGTDIGQ